MASKSQFTTMTYLRIQVYPVELLKYVNANFVCFVYFPITDVVNVLCACLAFADG